MTLSQLSLRAKSLLWVPHIDKGTESKSILSKQAFQLLHCINTWHNLIYSKIRSYQHLSFQRKGVQLSCFILRASDTEKMNPTSSSPSWDQHRASHHTAQLGHTGTGTIKLKLLQPKQVTKQINFCNIFTEFHIEKQDKYQAAHWHLHPFPLQHLTSYLRITRFSSLK